MMFTKKSLRFVDLRGNIIITTGLVSVFVINDYNSCLAHSVYYGCTTLKKIEKNHLHGEVVSYGVLVMLTCDKQYDDKRNDLC